VSLSTLESSSGHKLRLLRPSDTAASASGSLLTKVVSSASSSEIQFQVKTVSLIPVVASHFFHAV